MVQMFNWLLKNDNMGDMAAKMQTLNSNNVRFCN